MTVQPEDSAFQNLRPLMFAIAYRMLGRVTEAEDIVQEALLRYHRAVTSGSFQRPGQAGPGEPDSPKAYLSAVTTRLCIDHLRSARARREAYVGEWLPEPLLTGPAGAVVGGMGAAGGPGGVLADPAEAAEQADSLSMAFLLLLERLSPVERAVFLLHDVFGYGYDETAQIVGKSEDNCRQLARRARQHVGERRPRYEPSRDKRDELAEKFFAAVGDGDMNGLVDMLAADAAVYGDSAGQRPSWPRPIFGREHVGRLLAALGLAGPARRRRAAADRGQRSAGPDVPGRRRVADQRAGAGHRRRPGAHGPLGHEPGQAPSPGAPGRRGGAAQPAAEPASRAWRSASALDGGWLSASRSATTSRARPLAVT